jgi:hypothetical protein
MDGDLLGTTITCFVGTLSAERASVATPSAAQPGKARCCPTGGRLF